MKSRKNQIFEIIVTYCDKNLNLEDKFEQQNGYFYQNKSSGQRWLLKDQLRKLIFQTLKKGVSGVKQACKLRILNEKAQKLNDTGVYQFDPLCYSMKIQLVNTKGQHFRKYKLEEREDIEIKYKKVLKIQEDIQTQIKDNTSIDVLMLIVGNNLDIAQERVTNYLENCKKNLIRTTKDLKDWTEEEIMKWTGSNLRVSKQLKRLINQVKIENQKSFSSKKIKKLKYKQVQQCLKISYSHRLLRYCVYINDPASLQKISYLNIKAIDMAIKAINIQMTLNEEINQKLKYFLFQFALPHPQNYVYSRGAIFNGPPGTGKTVITELLMYLAGFVLIASGVSAADFSKTYVGQAGRMIEGLFSRADLCPYLLCSIGIDEIEGAFPDRNSDDQKNKGEGTSQFLSVIQGNKNIPNLLFLSSTNHIKKIDKAILRRLGDQFELPRLNQQNRQQIIIGKHKGNQKNGKMQDIGDHSYFRDKQNQSKLLISLTMNFTGAALKKLLSQLQNILQIKKQVMNDRNPSLTNSQIEQTVKKIANQYKIFFGTKTLPELIERSSRMQKYLSKDFLQKMQNKFMLIVFYEKNDQLSLAYINKVKTRSGEVCNQLQQVKFNIFKTLKKQKYRLNEYCNIFNEQISSYFDCQIKYCETIAKANEEYNAHIQRSSNKLKIILIPDQTQVSNIAPLDALNDIKCFNQTKQNFYAFYICKDVKIHDYFGMFKSENKYSGRIMLQVSEAPTIVYELKPSFPQDRLVYIQHYMSGNQKPRPDDVIPNLLSFFDQRKLSNLFMIDNQFLHEHNAFSSGKDIEVVEGIIQQARKLKQVGVIINFDSILVSSKGEKKSQTSEYSVQNGSLYTTLINIARNFNQISRQTQRWIAIIAKEPELIQKIRKDIYWPEMPEDVKRREQEEQNNRERQCCRCLQYYTEADNQKERTCFQHPGLIINTNDFSRLVLPSSQYAAMENQLQQYRNTGNNNNRGPIIPTYIYACCYASVKDNDNFCLKRHAFRHIEKNQENTLDDELNLFRNPRYNDWENNKEHFRKSMNLR